MVGIGDLGQRPAHLVRAALPVGHRPQGGQRVADQLGVVDHRRSTRPPGDQVCRAEVVLGDPLGQPQRPVLGSEADESATLIELQYRDEDVPRIAVQDDAPGGRDESQDLLDDAESG